MAARPPSRRSSTEIQSSTSITTLLAKLPVTLFPLALPLSPVLFWSGIKLGGYNLSVNNAKDDSWRHKNTHDLMMMKFVTWTRSSPLRYCCLVLRKIIGRRCLQSGWCKQVFCYLMTYYFSSSLESSQGIVFKNKMESFIPMRTCALCFTSYNQQHRERVVYLPANYWLVLA